MSKLEDFMVSEKQNKVILELQSDIMNIIGKKVSQFDQRDGYIVVLAAMGSVLNLVHDTFIVNGIVISRDGFFKNVLLGADQIKSQALASKYSAYENGEFVKDIIKN